MPFLGHQLRPNHSLSLHGQKYDGTNNLPLLKKTYASAVLLSLTAIAVLASDRSPLNGLAALVGTASYSNEMRISKLGTRIQNDSQKFTRPTTLANLVSNRSPLSAGSTFRYAIDVE